MQTGLYAQFGCGFSAPAGWLNFDSSPTLRFERLPLLGRLYTRNNQRFPSNVRYGNIIRGLPLSPDSCAGVYGSHVLEHLARNDLGIALQNIFRYLLPGGTFRLVVPDLERLARDYLANTNPEAANKFMEDSYLGEKDRPRGPGGFVRSWFGNSRHLWMWDERSLGERLRAHGFTDVRRAAFGDAEDSRFREVEDAGRFAGCLAMQCRKPGGTP
jgi:SAM-dependent methyltransferase